MSLPHAKAIPRIHPTQIMKPPISSLTKCLAVKMRWSLDHLDPFPGAEDEINLPWGRGCTWEGGCLNEFKVLVTRKEEGNRSWVDNQQCQQQSTPLTSPYPYARLLSWFKMLMPTWNILTPAPNLGSLSDVQASSSSSFSYSSNAQKKPRVLQLKNKSHLNI